MKGERVNGVDISAADVIITVGISEGIHMFMVALIDADIEVLLPGPVYAPYVLYARFFGGKPATYEAVKEKWLAIKHDGLRSRISEKTCGIVTTTTRQRLLER